MGGEAIAGGGVPDPIHLSFGVPNLVQEREDGEKKEKEGQNGDENDGEREKRLDQSTVESVQPKNRQG